MKKFITGVLLALSAAAAIANELAPDALARTVTEEVMMIVRTVD